MYAIPSLSHLHHAPSGACAQLKHIYTIMSKIILTKIGPRHGVCLGLYTTVYEIVIWVILRNTREARFATEFDNQQLKLHAIKKI